MRPLKETPVFLLAILLTSLLLASQVTAQANLPKLPGSATDGTSSAEATSAGNSVSSTVASQTVTTAEESSSATESSSVTSAPSLTSLPPISTTIGASSYDGITNAPKIGAQPVTPSVPPTADAPFMQKSSLPEGTVFICVGAALGFFGMAVLAWRGLVAWSLHRSVRRAAIAQSNNHRHGGDIKKKIRRKSAAPFYSHGPGSTLSLDQLGASGKGGVKGTAPAASLFFSPTAGAGMHTPGNRGSSYLPAGYYAAGNSAAGGGAGMTHIGGGSPMGLANLGPQSQGYKRARSMGPSPPESPSLPPSRGTDMPFGKVSNVGLSTQPSTSSLSLTQPPQGRAPSAYLEDLFENYPPGHIPGGPPSSDRRY
ncbi:hypothetical protein MMC24_004898 [Lignoscripta atroalba]|nr:hypothetical protein [Lignoscripta atroalba]